MDCLKFDLRLDFADLRELARVQLAKPEEYDTKLSARLRCVLETCGRAHSQDKKPSANIGKLGFGERCFVCSIRAKWWLNSCAWWPPKKEGRDGVGGHSELELATEETINLVQA